MRNYLLPLIFIFIVFIIACKEKNPSDDIEILHFYEHSDNEDIGRKIVDTYMELHPHIQIVTHVIPNQDYDEEIKIPLTAHADMDVLWVRGGAEMKLLARQGLLRSMNSFLAENGKDISDFGSLEQAMTYEGEIYGLPTSKSCWLLWYNKDLFDAAGEDYPIGITWNEYSHLAKKLKTEDIYGSIYPPWIMNLGALALGEYLTDESLKRTQEFASYFYQWINIDKSHVGIQDMSGSFDINQFFSSGGSYMMINGDWELLLLPSYEPSFTWAAAPLPVFEDAPSQATVGSAGCLSIPANSKNAELAYDFIQFYCFSDQGASLIAENNQVPAYPSEAALKVYKELVKVPGVEYVFTANVGSETGNEYYYDQLNESFKTELKDALVLGLPVEEVIKNFKLDRDAIIRAAQE